MPVISEHFDLGNDESCIQRNIFVQTVSRLDEMAFGICIPAAEIRVGKYAHDRIGLSIVPGVRELHVPGRFNEPDHEANCERRVLNINRGILCPHAIDQDWPVMENRGVLDGDFENIVVVDEISSSIDAVPLRTVKVERLVPDRIGVIEKCSTEYQARLLGKTFVDSGLKRMQQGIIAI